MSLKVIPRTLRMNNWWKSKIPLYLGLFFLFAYPHRLTVDLVKQVSFLFLWLVAAASLGYFINDWFDIEEDIASNRENNVAGIASPARILIFTGLAIATILPWALSDRLLLLFFALLQIIAFLIYSAPPLRLKNRLYMGVITDGIYAFVIPSLIAITLAWEQKQLSVIIYVSITIWAFCAGVRAILLHHLKDRKIDKKVSVGNVVNKFGAKVNLALLNFLFLPEIVALLLILYGTENFLLNISFLALYLLLQIALVSVNGIRFSVKRKWLCGKVSLFEFYESWLPIILFIGMIEYDWRLVSFCLVFLLLFRLALYYHLFSLLKFLFYHIVLRIVYFLNNIIYHIAIRKTYFGVKRIILVLYYHVVLPTFYYTWFRICLPVYYFLRYQVFTPFLYKMAFNILRPLLSTIINYTIYGYRRVFLRLSDKQARSLNLEIPYLKYVLNGDFIPRAYTKSATVKATEGAHSNSNVPVNLEKNTTQENILHINPGKLSDDNLVVNGLWIGEELSRIELLTINSFIENGHEFNLWVYNTIKTKLPTGVKLRDANDIIPASRIFRYKYVNTFGHGKGSVSGFSDVFRYKLLLDNGGWWTDMDITCLKPLNISTPYFFRKHHDLPLVGNLMKCPPNSSLMKRCYEEASLTIDENNRDWHKPIKILNKNVFSIGLEQYIFDGFTNEDKWDEVKNYIKGNQSFSEKYLAIHWMNEEWRSRAMNKNDIRLRSTLGGELLRYSLIQAPTQYKDLYLNELRHRVWLPVYQLFLREV